MKQNITVQEMFDYALENEHIVLAHVIYWGIEQKLVSLATDSNELLKMPIDEVVVRRYAEQNILGMRMVKLFVIKHSNGLYAFYFANDSLSAVSEHNRLFGRAGSIVEAPSLMYKLMYLHENDEFVFLIDYKKRFVEFPVYIGHAKAHQYDLQRLDRRVNKVV